MCAYVCLSTVESIPELWVEVRRSEQLQQLKNEFAEMRKEIRSALEEIQTSRVIRTTIDMQNISKIQLVDKMTFIVLL